MTLRRRPRTVLMLLVLALFVLPILARAALFAASDAPRSWRDADWSSAGLLPPASQDRQARLIVFTGTAGAWKSVFAVHSWVVFKRADDRRWTRYDVVGWGAPVRTNNWPVDGRWYGATPVAIADVSGDAADRLIPRVEEAVTAYAYAEAGNYRVWPGPNSNSFVAAVLRAVPDLAVSLPPNAVGRDWRDGFYAGLTDSRTGIEVNAFGLVSLKIGWVEGAEINLLGLVAGLDLRHPGIKLPGFGRIGVPAPVATALAAAK